MATTAFERVQMARHPERPYALDLFTTIFEDFVEIHGRNGRAAQCRQRP